MKYLILCSIVMLYVGIGTADEYEIEWIDTINGRSNSATGIAVDIYGNIVVTGVTGYRGAGNRDYFTVKYDPDGNILWTDTLDNGDDDVAMGIAIDSSGNIIITGRSQINGDYDYFTVKYDSSSNILWADTIDNGGNDKATGIATDPFGNIVVTGYSAIYSKYCYFTVKYAPDGTILWADTVQQGSAEDVAIDPYGRWIAVTGAIGGLGSSSYFTVKYDSSGNIMWADTLGDNPYIEHWAWDIAIDIAGSIIVTGTICPGLSTEYDILTVKYKPEGEIMWIDTIRGLDRYSEEQAHGVAVDTARNIVIAGWFYLSDLSHGYSLVVKYDPLGNIVWVDTLDYGTHGCSFCDVAIDNLGNIILAGGYSSGVFPYSNYFTCKYKPIQGVEEKNDDKLFCSFNTPNPFVRFTNIRYRIPAKSKVLLRVYDVVGRCVKTLIDEEKNVGHYKVKWDGEGLPTGIYFAKFTAHSTGFCETGLPTGDYKSTKKLILIR